MQAAESRITPTKFLWLLGFVVTCTAPANAAVLEIAPDGSVTVYDGPQRIEGTPVTPIETPAVTSRARFSPQLDNLFSEAGASARLSPGLIAAVAEVESSFQSSAHSSKGSVGIMQLMPATAAMLRVDPRDIRQNVKGGAVYLQAMLQEFGGNLALALAAYNAGPEAVRRYGGVPPYRETQNYVARVMERLASLADVVQETGQ
jgi:soluble lytic murein transglycosylase-like protein